MLGKSAALSYRFSGHHGLRSGLDYIAWILCLASWDFMWCSKLCYVIGATGNRVVVLEQPGFQYVFLYAFEHWNLKLMRILSLSKSMWWPTIASSQHWWLVRQSYMPRSNRSLSAIWSPTLWVCQLLTKQVGIQVCLYTKPIHHTAWLVNCMLWCTWSEQTILLLALSVWIAGNNA